MAVQFSTLPRTYATIHLHHAQVNENLKDGATERRFSPVCGESGSVDIPRNCLVTSGFTIA